MPWFEQALGDVHGADVELLGLLAEGDDELVAGAAFWVGEFEAGLAQALHQVVGVQGGELADATHSVAAQHSGVGEGAQQDAGRCRRRRIGVRWSLGRRRVAASDRCRLPSSPLVWGRYGARRSLAPTGPRAGATAAVGCGEGFCAG